MKPLSEKQALAKLMIVKDEFRRTVRENYEHRAKDCLTCETQGACCLDAHFVNVHITRLEAVLINANLAELAPAKQIEIRRKITDTIEKYGLKTDGDTFAKTFACPLFEKGAGCLIHSVKPLACIAHACYERAADLPPDELQEKTELSVERLNQRTYRQSKWLPLPVWLDLLDK